MLPHKQILRLHCVPRRMTELGVPRRMTELGVPRRMTELGVPRRMTMDATYAARACVSVMVTALARSRATFVSSWPLVFTSKVA